MKLWTAEFCCRSGGKYWRDETINLGTFASKEGAEKVLEEKMANFPSHKILEYSVKEVEK